MIALEERDSGGMEGGAEKEQKGLENVSVKYIERVNGIF